MQIPRKFLAAVATPDGKTFAIGGADMDAYPLASEINGLFVMRLLYAGKTQDTVEVLNILP